MAASGALRAACYPQAASATSAIWAPGLTRRVASACPLRRRARWGSSAMLVALPAAGCRNGVSCPQQQSQTCGVELEDAAAVFLFGERLTAPIFTYGLTGSFSQAEGGKHQL